MSGITLYTQEAEPATPDAPNKVVLFINDTGNPAVKYNDGTSAALLRDGDAYSTSVKPVLTYNATGYEGNDIVVTIANFNDYAPGVTFGLTPQDGSAAIDGDTITWTLPDVDVESDYTLDVTAREIGKATSTSTATVTVQLIPFTVTGLDITDPVDGAIDIVDNHVVTAGTPVASDPAYNHVSTSWYVMDGATVVASSIDDLVNKNSWQIPAELSVSTSYTVYRRVKMSNGTLIFNIKSAVNGFTTADTFNGWLDFDDTSSSTIATFLSDLPYNLSATKITDTCSLASCRVGAALTQVGVALTRASAAAIDFTAASPFNVSTVNVNNNGLSSVTRLTNDWALFFYDPDTGLDSAVAVRAVAKGATEADWAASGSGITLSDFGYTTNVQASELNTLGSGCIYKDERSAGVIRIVVSEISRPTSSSDVLSKDEIFVGSESNSDKTAIMSMSENEIIFAYSYGGPPFAVKLYSATRPDSGSAWGTAQLLTSYESLTNAPQYLELTKMSADRFVLSYYEGDLADDRVRGKVFNRVGETWTAGNEFLTTSGSDAVRPKLTAPREDTVLIAYGTSNISLEVHTYDGTDWTPGTAVQVFDGTTGQKDLVFLSENQVLAVFQKTTAPAQGDMKTLVAG